MHENVKKNILLLSIVALLIIVPIAAQFVSMDRHFPLPTEDSVQSVAVVRSSEGYSDELTVKDEASIRLIYSELSSMRFKRSDKMLPAGGTLYEITLAIKDGTHESMSYYQFAPDSGCLTHDESEYYAVNLDLGTLWSELQN